MKKNIILLGALLLSSMAFSQVGINTTTPTATLDVVAKNATGISTNTDGLVIPRIDRQRAQSMSGIATSTLIYVNSISTGTATGAAANINSIGFYYYDGALWSKLDNVGDATIDALVNDPTNTMVKLGTNADGSTARAVGTDFVVKDTGFVGVGTSTPANQLDVTSSLSNATLASIGNASQKLLLGISTVNNGAYLTTASGTTNSLRLGVNGAEHIRIDAQTATLGNVGFGTGNIGVNYPLQVHRTGIVSVYSQITSGQTGALSTDGLLWGVDSTGRAVINNQENSTFSILNNGTERITVLSNGNVGVGTINPTLAKFHVNAATAGTGFRLTDTTEGAGKVLTSDANGNASWATNVSITPTILGSLPASGLSMPNLNTNYYTQASITLPAGKWILSAGTVVDGGSTITVDGQLWNHIYVSDSNSSYVQSTSLVAGTGRAGAGTIGRGENYGMVIGNFLINNTSGGSKTYYIWMDSTNSGAVVSQRVSGAFGSGAWERWLYANPINLSSINNFV